MRTLEQEQILITGGSRGLGLGLVEALAARHANVTVVARDSAPLADLKARLGVSVIAGDATDPALADSVLRQVRPSVLVLNAGATPAMAPLQELGYRRQGDVSLDSGRPQHAACVQQPGPAFIERSCD